MRDNTAAELMNLKKRTMDEMITHFNDAVSAMDISSKDKMTILGMITAIGYEYQKAADAIEELATFKEQITDGHFYCMRDGVLYEAKVDPPKGKVFHLPQIEFQEPPKENEKSET